ncbi:hypothetical protein [Nostoc sp. UHCC 0302]
MANQAGGNMIGRSPRHSKNYAVGGVACGVALWRGDRGILTQ